MGFGKTVSTSNRLSDAEVIIDTDRDLVWLSTESI